MKRAIFFVSLVFMVALASFATQYASSLGNPWTAKTSLSIPTVGLEAAVANGKIYAFRSSINYENDPGGMWTTKSSMPTWRYNVAVASYQNKIYVIGGATNDSSPTGTNQAYDPANDAWKTMASMPTPRHSLDANVVNGKIYLIGGLVPHHLFPNDKGTYEATNVTEVYDPATDSWTTKTSVPNAVHNYASAVVNNKIYLISETLTQIYNPDNDSWSLGTPPPYSVDMAGCAATTGTIAPQRIYVIGGRESGLEANYNQIYDPATDSWSLGTPMPTGRYSLGVAAVNDVIYAFGGLTGAFVVVEQKNQVEQYNPLEDPTVPAPTPSQTPTPLLTHTPTPNPTPPPSQTPTSTPSQTSAPTPSPSMTPTETPTTSPSQQPETTPPTDLYVIAAAAAALVVVVAVAAVFLRKRK